VTQHSSSEAGGLVAAGLGLTYGAAGRALDGIDIVVPEGAVVALLGANGAGKTSFLRAVSGNTRRHRATVTGELTYRGRSLVGASPAQTVRRGIVQVPEGRRIFTSLSVAENLAVGGLPERSPAKRREALAKVLGLFPLLHDRRNQPAGLLSGGEQQMLAMGRALMASPSLILLDEPSLGLAPKMIAAVMDVIRDISADGTSVLLIEQNAAAALAVAQYAYVLSLGRVALQGPTSDAALMDEVTKLYLGVSHEREEAAVATPARSTTLTRWDDQH